MLNREKLIWGLVLIGIGSLFLLDNLGFIEFHWISFWRMWPLILVVIGINLILPKRGIGHVLAVLTVILTFAFLMFVGINDIRPNNSFFGNMFSNKIGNDYVIENRSGGMVKQKFVQSVDPSIEFAKLKIEGGAVSYRIADPDSVNLFYAFAESDFGTHVKTFEKKGSKAEISFKMENHKGKDIQIDGSRNNVTMKLNARPTWTLDLDLGAGAADFDLREYKIEKLDVDCGAASFKAKLGDPLAQTLISIDSGAGSVKLQIPEGAACKIRTKTGLSSRDFPGFDKINSDTFQTSDFDESQPHFLIELEGGLSAFKVVRGN